MWTLVIVLWLTQGVSINSVPSFSTKEKCREAGVIVATITQRIQFECVQTSAPLIK